MTALLSDFTVKRALDFLKRAEANMENADKINYELRSLKVEMLDKSINSRTKGLVRFMEHSGYKMLIPPFNATLNTDRGLEQIIGDCMRRLDNI
ncbi:hypothetical protein B9Z55_004368 [Caenorhabditis nigoni]|uniref:Uncharacterized protein n=1 Tax=Caenorhabditis nigoni TaxID=1611254 RepID=A0A2G5UW67_9PELO|nr:hypothetical protein B9Z55_004368 [Caenorhabditis nigoni]